MLRSLFGEPKAIATGITAQTINSIQRYCSNLPNYLTEPENRCMRGEGTLELRAFGLLRALDELEQSCYASEKYKRMIDRRTPAHEMSAEQLDHYHQHVYFYKNAFVRVFSTLDKLGHFIDEALELNTRKVKRRFSYFTVLREIRRYPKYRDLYVQLNQHKNKYKNPLEELRAFRNIEVHAVNIELMDELQKSGFTDEIQIENVTQNMFILEQGFEMVCHSMKTTFDFCSKRIT